MVSAVIYHWGLSWDDRLLVDMHRKAHKSLLHVHIADSVSYVSASALLTTEPACWPLAVDITHTRGHRLPRGIRKCILSST